MKIIDYSSLVGKKVQIKEGKEGLFGTSIESVKNGRRPFLDDGGAPTGFVVEYNMGGPHGELLKIYYGEGELDFDYYKLDDITLLEDKFEEGNIVKLVEGGQSYFEDFGENDVGRVTGINCHGEAEFRFSGVITLDWDRADQDQLTHAHGPYLPFGELVEVKGLDLSPSIFPGAVAVVLSRKRQVKSDGGIELMSVNAETGIPTTTWVELETSNEFSTHRNFGLRACPGNFLAPISKDRFASKRNNKEAREKWLSVVHSEGF